MPKFRILKIEKTNAINEKTVFYKIQIKYLFFWFDYIHKVAYIHLKGSPVWGAVVNKEYCNFSDEETALFYLKELRNPYIEYYKGNLLKRIMTYSSYEYSVIYLNYSKKNYCKNKIGYEYEFSIKRLKKSIDERDYKVKITEIL